MGAVSEIMSRDFPTLDSRLKPSLILYLCGVSLKITLDLIKHSFREILRNEGAKQKIFATTIILYLDAIFSVLMWVEGFNFQSSNEERDHGMKLMEYQAKRGGRVVFQDIAKPSSMEWGTPLEAVEAALELEK